MTHPDSYLNRRRFLIGSATVASSLQLGCDKQEQVVTPTETGRKQTPLRILMLGQPGVEEIISRGWQAISEQELKIEVVELERANSDGIGDVFLEAATKADLVIYPLALVGEAARSDTVVEITTDDIQRIESKVGPLYSAARNGAARYGASTFALPLGCKLPALLSRSKLQPLESWESYDKLVEDEWDGMAAEPTADGWAGTMFMWRCSGLENWLFERGSLAPMINTEPYVKSLDLMLRTNSRYTQRDCTPDQIWSLVAAGELQGGIGFPERSSESESDARLLSLPEAETVSKVMLDPFSPVVSLSANCRQTSASKLFIAWICGGEGSGSVRRQIAGMGDLRDGGISSGDAGAYESWLSRQLQAPLIAACPQLNSAMGYLTVLDEQVRQALAGECTAQEALNDVAERWQSLTSSEGLEEQMRAWRMAQGMRS